MNLCEKYGMNKSCLGWQNGLKAISLLIMTFVAMAFSSTALAQGFHGITFAKGCAGPTKIGSPYLCQYVMANQGGDSGNGGVGSVDTLTFKSLTDIVHAGSDVSSGDILATLFLTATGNGTSVCTPAGLPGTGNTSCTLPPGAAITTDFFSFYTAQLGDPDPLSDTATLIWNDLCDTGSNNCPLGDQTTTSGSQSPLTCATDCDDSNACTADSCDELTNECVNGPPTDCDDSNACTDDSCDPATGECVNTVNSNCDDSNACTADSCDPATGECVNTADVDCDDSNACTDDSCDPTTGLCVNTDNSECDDGNACTDDSCDPATGECVSTDSRACDDNNACTDDSCDPTTGECVSVVNGQSCEPIPTLSGGGLVAMILTMLGLGGILIRRRFLRKTARF